MERLLTQHPDDPAGMILRLAWKQGLLREEITNLTWEQVSFDSGQIELPDRTVPLCEEMAEYLGKMYERWSRSIRVQQNSYVVRSIRYRTQMQPEAISRVARKTLDEAGQTAVRLIDLRHDYVIRQLEEHDWRYVARITNVDICSLQLHFCDYLPEGKAGPKHTDRMGEIDEFKLWKILQAEKDTPAGLALWLTWSMGLTATEMVSLTWDEVDFQRGVLTLPEREVPLTAAVRRMLESRYQARTEDPHVLLTAESRTPLDISRVSKITRMALIRGGLEHCTLRDLWVKRGKNDWEQKITETIRQKGPITRSEVMEMFGLSKFAAYQRLRTMIDKGLLIRVGYKYYLPGSVVPPEQQQEALYEYLKEEGFACRKDITNALRIEREQCTLLLKHEVDSGTLVKIGQKYFLKES